MSYDLFNAQGELNADSLKDAFEKINKFASIIEDGNPSNLALAGQPSISDDKRDSLVERALLSTEGKVALAQAIN